MPSHAVNWLVTAGGSSLSLSLQNADDAEVNDVLFKSLGYILEIHLLQE